MPIESRGPRHRGGRRAVGAEGFSLVEVVVSLGLLLLLALGTAPFFYQALTRTAVQGLRQSAVAVGSRSLEDVRAVPARKLIDGRAQVDVAALNAAPGLVDLSRDDTSGGNFDSGAAAGSPAAVVPLIATDVLGGVTFTSRTYINRCYRALTTSSDCTASASAGAAQLFRVSVDIVWPRNRTDGCASRRPGYCEYVATSLRDPSDDPIFKRNVTAPTITQVTTSPTPLHPLQAGTVTFTGTGYVSGASVTSSDGGDTLSAVGSNTGVSLTVPFQASATPGTRTLRITNPDGGNVAATITVTSSAPQITGITPTSFGGGQTVRITVQGSDFYAAGPGGSQQPTVTATGSAYGYTFALTVRIVQVQSSTSESFDLTVPSYSGQASLRVTTTNPDGGVDSQPFSVSVS